MTKALSTYHKLIQGDKSTIQELYDRILPKLTSWIVKNSGHRSASRDILHEALTAIIIAGVKKKQNPPSNLDAYIFTICKYKWLDVLKKRKVNIAVTFEEQLRDNDGRSVQDEFIELEHQSLKHQIAERSFLRLSSLCRQLLDFVKEGLKAKEIAAKLGMSGQSTVNRRKFACMDSWRKFVKEDKDYHLITNND